jgi:hypothetical protein
MLPWSETHSNLYARCCPLRCYADCSPPPLASIPVLFFFSVCRSKHKGMPHAVRSADNTIDVLVEQFLVPEAKEERLVRTQRIDAEQRTAAAKQLEKDNVKLAELLRIVDQNPQLLLGGAVAIQAVENENQNE